MAGTGDPRASPRDPARPVRATFAALARSWRPLLAVIAWSFFLSGVLTVVVAYPMRELIGLESRLTLALTDQMPRWTALAIVVQGALAMLTAMFSPVGAVLAGARHDQICGAT